MGLLKGKYKSLAPWAQNLCDVVVLAQACKKSHSYVWVTVGVIAIALGIAGTWLKGGFSAVQDLTSPFNVVNWVVIAIALGPGLGVLANARRP